MPLEPIQGIEAEDAVRDHACGVGDGCGYWCTLLLDHEGDHEAGVGNGMRVAFWPQKAGE